MWYREYTDSVHRNKTSSNCSETSEIHAHQELAAASKVALLVGRSRVKQIGESFKDSRMSLLCRLRPCEDRLLTRNTHIIPIPKLNASSFPYTLHTQRFQSGA
jgi:hypothetical protein